MTATEHTLVQAERGHYINGPYILACDLVGLTGRALCSCRWLSAPLPTAEARRQAHAQHVTEEQP